MVSAKVLNLHTRILHKVLNFLTFFVYVADNFIHTKLFSKKSDTHCYLIPKSCHKDHVVQNIPFGVARSVRQNNSEDTNFEEQRVLYSSHLSRRGYNCKIINDAFNKFSDITNRILLNLMLRIRVKGSPLF